MKELLLYNVVYSYTAEAFINTLEANKNSDIAVRINTPGGDVYGSYGMIAKFNEHQRAKKVKVDGQAKSAGFFFCCAAEEVECLNVSEFLAHRAAAPWWVENDLTLFTEDIKQSLIKVNKDLREITEAKIPADVFKRVTGVSYDDLFSIDSRIDVKIDATQAKEMGLVQKINPLTSTLKKSIEALAGTYGIAAFAGDVQAIEEPTTEIPKKDKKMTATEFKAQHPDAAAEILKEGANAERERILALRAWEDVDKEFVAKAIEEGTTLSASKISELSRKAVSAAKLSAMEGEAAEEVETPATPEAKTAEAKRVDAIEANIVKSITAQYSK